MIRFTLILALLFYSTMSSSEVTYDFGARMEVDYSYYDDDDTYFIQEDSDIRRLRFAMFARLNDKISAYYQTDIANIDKTNKATTQAAWFRYRFNKNNEIFLGKMEMPFSLESVSNSKYHFFMERSLLSALTERYASGLNYIHYGDSYNIRVGIFADENLYLDKANTYGKTIASRIGKKFKLFRGKLYLGASLQYREPNTTQTIRALPESHTFNARLLDTGELFFVDSIEKYGIEALWKKNKWTIQSEYMINTFNREFGGNLNYSAGYFIVSKIFNGKRRFSFKKGEWSSTKVQKYKTWEASIRFSFLDLQSDKLNAGYEENISFGVNYYLTKRNRIMFNYIQARAQPNSMGINETLDIYQARFQFEF